jgi:large exoprotein involved in heme utilization and adhesion
LSNDLTVTSDGSISTDTFGDGTGSNIDITADNVNISNGGQISASTKRDGQAGAITINASGSVTISGAENVQTGLFSVSGDPDPAFQPPAVGAPFSGAGGQIAINADRLVVENGGLVSAEAINLGDAGDININLSDELLISDSSIVTSSTQAAGGEINIQAINLVSLVNSDITAEAFGVTVGNDGGNIFIDPVNVVLNSSNLVARANAGNGGNITVVADAFLRSPDSRLDATSQTGVDGEVLIETLNQNVDVIAVANEPFLDVAGLLGNRCAAQVLKNKSSFTVELYKSSVASTADFSYYQFFANSDNSKIYPDNYVLAGLPAANFACL